MTTEGQLRSEDPHSPQKRLEKWRIRQFMKASAVRRYCRQLRKQGIGFQIIQLRPKGSVGADES